MLILQVNDEWMDGADEGLSRDFYFLFYAEISLLVFYGVSLLI